MNLDEYIWELREAYRKAMSRCHQCDPKPQDNPVGKVLCEKHLLEDIRPRLAMLETIQGSSTVEQVAVNHEAGGSSPSPGAEKEEKK